ncbi:MAG: glycoside hydrolase family 125 protein [Bacteroidota bacterium]|nr:glycoside hydrolase family 125 protein [Bacteroidota bacterium]
MNRKQFIRQSSLASAALVFSKYSFAQNATNNFPTVRRPETQRKFKSKAVEKIIVDVKRNINNKEIGWMFENCFPNTLDTTVDFEIVNGKPDTYVITGDIDAMWLRDSTAQVWPYLPLCKEDKDLQQLIKGVIRRQSKCIIKDPYANAFYKDENKISEWKSDFTEMKPGVHERKWEIDSLCYPIRLSCDYYAATGDISIFDEQWLAAMLLVVKTFKEQQRFQDKGPYTFQRTTSWATDGIPLSGYGYPVKPNGLICSMFRPSDDATVFPYLIPDNLFALKVLHQLQQLPVQSNSDWKILMQQSASLIAYLGEALAKESIVKHSSAGNIYAYEVNGFGSYNMMDDANVPSLLSLPYLNVVSVNDPVYINTRKFILSSNNPFFFKGKAAEGIGGPHAGMNMVWPLSIIMRGLTSTDDREIKLCLDMLQKTHAGTGFIHESFHKDDSTNFTRKWFAWANTLFGEFVWKVYREKPQLLK